MDVIGQSVTSVRITQAKLKNAKGFVAGLNEIFFVTASHT